VLSTVKAAKDESHDEAEIEAAAAVLAHEPGGGLIVAADPFISFLPLIDHKIGGTASASGDLRLSGVRRARRID
jgi:hypothetical protein